MVKKIINFHKSIIFLNGTFPEKKMFSFLNTNVPLIAADGAIQKMYQFELCPTYVIGDMDSSKKPQKNIKKIKILNQNFTDFEKCLTFVKKEKLFPSLIIGVNGGEIDHLIGNIQIMVKHAKKNPMYFLDTYQNKNLIGVKLGIPIANQLSFITKKGNCMSIITFEKTILSTKGLKWELSNKLLHVDGVLGLRNETISNRIEITVKKGKAIIILDISNFFK